MPARPVVVDPYSPLSHKALVGHPDVDPNIGAPTWAPRHTRRRIRALLARGAYLGNVARDLLGPDTTDKARAAHREYGDPAAFVRRTVAAIIGDDATWTIDGADDDLPDEPDLPPEPEDPGPDATEVARRIFAARADRWAAEVDAIADQWEADWAAQPSLRARQAAYRAWVDRQNIDLTVRATEQHTTGLGESVVVLWHQDGDWPRPEIIPPGACFPVLDEHDDGQFPSKYHLAWEYDEDTRDATGAITTERRLRRVTFELVLINDLRATGAGEERTWVDADGQPTDTPMVRTDERVVVDGRDGKSYLTRTYPWDRPEPADDGDTRPDPRETAADREPSRYVCLYSDGTWPLNDLGHDAYALDESNATWRPYGDGVAYRADYGIDYLPLIHTEGLAIIDMIAQVLDDLAGADTAAAGASRYIKDPTVFAPGVEAVTQMMPGRIIGGPEGGRMDVLDLSGGLEKLEHYRDSLRDRATGNVGIPSDLLGGTSGEGGNPESGLSRLIRYTPWVQLIGELRMSRKWDLFGKFAMRMAQVQGALPPGPTPTVRLAFGSFLPTDRSQTLTDVAEGVRAHVLSLQTAVRYLVAAGFPIDDARAEVDRIRVDDTAAANTLADALAGHPDLLAIVSDRLGVPAPVEAPVVPLDPLVPPEDE